MVYDITNSASFENINDWLEIIKKATDDDIVIYLIGNKADLAEDERKRKVTKEMAIHYSKSKHFQGFGECSALKNVNIKETFESFYKTLYKKNKTKLKEKTERKVILLKESMKNKSSKNNKECC